MYVCSYIYFINEYFLKFCYENFRSVLWNVFGVIFFYSIVVPILGVN